MLKYKLLGLFTIAIFIFSFLHCTVAVEEPIKDKLIQRIECLSDCSEYEAGLICEIFAKQKNSELDDEFSSLYIKYIEGDQEAKELYNVNAAFQNYVDDLDNFFCTWKHKSLEEKAQALCIDDIFNEDEYLAFLENNCTNSEKVYIFERSEDIMKQMDIVVAQCNNTGKCNVKQWEHNQKNINNILNQLYSKAIVYREEYRLLNVNNNSDFSYLWDINDTIGRIMTNNSLTDREKVVALTCLKKDYKTKFDLINNRAQQIDNLRKHVNIRYGFIYGSGVSITTTGSIMLAKGLASLNPVDILLGSIVLACGLAILVIASLFTDCDLMIVNINNLALAEQRDFAPIYNQADGRIDCLISFLNKTI